MGCGGHGSSDPDAAVDADRVDAEPPPLGDNRGFTAPGVVTRAHENTGGVWQDVGPADWSCLDSAGDLELDDVTTVSVSIEDFQTGNRIAGGELRVFDRGASTGAPIGNATTDENGDATVVLPAGTVRPTVQIVGSGQVDTYWIDALDETGATQRVTLGSVSELTANALPAFIGASRTPGLGLSAGAIRDCQGRLVSGAVVAVSALPGIPHHLVGATTYYFSGGSTSLPVRHSQQSASNVDGLYMVIEIPPGDSVYLQAWGYAATQTPGVDAMMLLAEYKLQVAADSFVGPKMRPGLHH